MSSEFLRVTVSMAALVQLFPRSLLAVVAAGSTGAMLAIPYNYPSLYLLTWVAFVPLLWVAGQRSPWAGYGLGLCAGLVMYVVGAFWIVDFIELYKGFDSVGSRIGAVFFWLYCAQLPACLFLLYGWLCRRLCRRIRVPEIFLFPPLVALFYSYFPMLFPVQLAGAQSRFLIALQATEFFGAASLDFMIALTNVLLLLCLRELNARWGGTRDRNSTVGNTRPVLPFLSAALITAWLAYGVTVLPRWEAAVEDWPVKQVGMVQPNETPSEELPLAVPGYSRAYPPELALTEQIAAAGAEVMVWPETRYKGYFEYPHVRHSFSQHMAELGVPLMFQDIEVMGRGRDKTQYNTAVFLEADGELAGRYRKIKRVPFGEYVPLLQHVEPLQDWFYSHFPALFANFLPGDGPAVFAVGDFAMIPLICYEVMFPEFTARAVREGRGGVLVAISNNGWFGDSFQPYQHLHASVLRSVENRVPLLHVTNNGPSGLVLPSGRLVVETAYHEKMAVVLAVPYSPGSGGTFFSRYPGLFLRLLLIVVGLLIVSALSPARLP